MPFRKRYRPRRRRGRKRRRRTVRKRRRRKMRFSKTVAPYLKRVKMIYVQRVSLDPTAGLLAVNVFRANSLFDPDFSGVGHQPMGFDDMAYLYEKYRVFSVSMKVTFTNADTTYYAVSGIHNGVHEETPVPDPLDMREQNRTRWRQLAPTHASVQGNESATVTYSCKPWKSLHTAYKDKNYASFVTGNPAEVCYIYVFLGPLNSIDNLAAGWATVRMTYFGEFFQPKFLTGS